MLNQLSAESSNRLRTFFDEAGYTESNLRKHLAAAELPSPRLRNRARLMYRTSSLSQINTLLRWFWLGNSQDREESAAQVPGEILSLMLESGLLTAEGRMLAPAAMLLHIDGFLIASDHPVAIENRQAEMVLWPNP